MSEPLNPVEASQDALQVVVNQFPPFLGYYLGLAKFGSKDWEPSEGVVGWRVQQVDTSIHPTLRHDSIEEIWMVFDPIQREKVGAILIK